MTTLSCRLALTAALMLGALHRARSEPLAEAAGPTQIEPGNLLVLDLGGPQRWVLMPHPGPEYQLYVVTLSGEEVDVAVHVLPIGGDPEPDDPDDPPPDEKTLAELVDAWADEVNDPANRPRLSAVYEFSVQLIDSGALPTVEALMGFQVRADKLALGDSAPKWTPFLQRVKDHLDAHVADDLAAYRAAWVEIADGLARGEDPAVLQYWRRYEAAKRRKP